MLRSRAWLLCVLLALSAHVSKAAMQWKVCDESQRPMTAETVTLTPDPPVIGSPANFLIKATSGESAFQVLIPLPQ